MITNLVSIIIPTHNRSKLIVRAIKSVLIQSYQNFEILIADDGSTDNTEQVVTEFHDNRIHYLKLTKVGRSAARNYALKKAQGEWIAFLDSDDEFCLGKLEKQISLLKMNPQYQICYTRGRVIDETNQNLIYENMYRANFTGDIYFQIALYKPLIVLLPSVVLSRTLFEKVGYFDESLDRFEDTDYWRRCARESEFLGIDIPLVNIYNHGGNRMECPKVVLDHLKRYVEKVLEEDSEKYGRKNLLKIAGRFVNHYATAVMLNRQYKFASLSFSIFSLSLRLDLPETWINIALAFLPLRVRSPLILGYENIFFWLRNYLYIALGKYRAFKRLLGFKPKT